MKLRQVFETVLLLAFAAGTVQAEIMVGLEPSDGISMLVKRYPLPAGAVVTGAEFRNNDSRTVFPEVLLIRGGISATSEGSVVASVTGVTESQPGWVRFNWSTPVVVVAAGDYLLAVRIPEGPGKQGPGDGPALGGELDVLASRDFIAAEENGELFPIAVELNMSLLLATGASKAGAARQQPAPAPESRTETFLRVHQVRADGASLSFGLAQAGRSSITIYDVTGRVVRNVVNEVLGSGAYQRTWDGRDDGGRRTASGVYIVRLETSDKQLTKKLVLTQ